MDEIVTQNATKEMEVWQPTNAMRKWLDAAMELGYTASITAISEKANVNRKMWYLWQGNEKFVEWWEKQWKKFIKLNKHKLDLIGLKQAETNHDWWRDMKKVVGEPISEDPVLPQNAIQINNNILKPEEIERITED